MIADIQRYQGKPPTLLLQVLTSLILALAPITASHSDNKAEEFKLVEWSALVPRGWEPPLIAPAPAADGHYPVDPDSLVHELDKQRVALPGFMIPVRYEQNVVSELLFVPYLPHHTRSHAHHDANQMIYVRLDTPATIENPFGAWFVSGQLLVESVTTEDGRTGYTLEQARAEPYDAEKHDQAVVAPREAASSHKHKPQSAVINPTD